MATVKVVRFNPGVTQIIPELDREEQRVVAENVDADLEQTFVDQVFGCVLACVLVICFSQFTTSRLSPFNQSNKMGSQQIFTAVSNGNNDVIEELCTRHGL